MDTDGSSDAALVSSSYELQHALHMRSIMHCFVRRGVRGYLNILVVVIVKF